MAILQIYRPEEFYMGYDQKKISPGQLCRIVVPYLDPVPRILEVERNHPEEHDYAKFTLRNAKDGDFQRSDRTLPLKYLKLRSNEELLVQRAKKRPGIILSSEVDIFSDITKILKQRAKKHQQEDSLFIIPLYGTESHDDLSGYVPEIVERTRCLLYRQFFYLPPYKGFKECIARFDRIQIVSGRDRIAIEPLELGLSDTLFGLLMSLLKCCLSGEEDDELAALRELTREKYLG